jgi:hypothetical protein
MAHERDADVRGGAFKELRGDAPETLGLLARRAQRTAALPVIQRLEK